MSYPCPPSAINSWTFPLISICVCFENFTGHAVTQSCSLAFVSGWHLRKCLLRPYMHACLYQYTRLYQSVQQLNYPFVSTICDLEITYWKNKRFFCVKNIIPEVSYYWDMGTSILSDDGKYFWSGLENFSLYSFLMMHKSRQ
jgi:hypothetical protein